MSAENGKYAIDLHDVRKTYRGKVRALRGIEMQVHRGEIFGLLGPNGAGKSTLVKIMMTVVRATKARGTMLGAPIGDKGTLARVGYLPEHHRMPPYLTGRQILMFYGAMAKVPRPLRRKRAAELMETVGMTDWAKKKLGQYSKGMLQRIGLAQALMNDPELVVLDEPTDGVDPVGRRDIRDVLARLKDQNRTVFLNSHLLSELEMVCDRVSILVQGSVSRQGTLDELTQDSRRYEIVIEGPPPDWDGTLEVAATTDKTSTLVFKGAKAVHMQTVVDHLRTEGRTIVSMQPRRETLEDLFMRAVTDPTTGDVLKPGADRPGRKAAGKA